MMARKKNIESIKQKEHDLAMANHGMWLSLKDHGLLVNGHLRVGQRIPDKSKIDNKLNCRKKQNMEDI